MRSIFSVAAAVLGLTSTFITASPVFPVNDGFPTPSPDQVKKIEQKALGTLSNATPPPNASADGLISLRLIALNELFEVAFFEDLICNITKKVEGYTFTQESHDFVLKSLKAVQNVSHPASFPIQTIRGRKKVA
jgi:hypothetical protein